MAYSFPPKDPDDVLDYTFDFAADTNNTGDSDWLDTANSETISSYAITAQSGITVDSDSRTDSNTSVTVWLSGGTAGSTYTVACKIVTSASRTKEVTGIVEVQSR